MNFKQIFIVDKKTVLYYHYTICTLSEAIW